MIYFIQPVIGGRVKIGRTQTDLGRRLQQIQAYNHEPLQIIRTLEGDTAQETWLHDRYGHLRRHHEWFDFDPEMLTVVPPEAPPQSFWSDMLAVRALTQELGLGRLLKPTVNYVSHRERHLIVVAASMRGIPLASISTTAER